MKRIGLVIAAVGAVSFFGGSLAQNIVDTHVRAETGCVPGHYCPGATPTPPSCPPYTVYSPVAKKCVLAATGG